MSKGIRRVMYIGPICAYSVLLLTDCKQCFSLSVLSHTELQIARSQHTLLMK